MLTDRPPVPDKLESSPTERGSLKKARVAAATTPTTNGLAVTTGYLLKLSVTPSKIKGVQSPGVWKKRFFMLRGCTLTYYADHQSMDSPKGELLVFGETKYALDEQSSQKHSFTLAIPFAMINLSCETGIDFFLWTKAFKKSIALAQQALRSYIDKVVETEEIIKRKFFILHQDAITVHRDENSTSSVQGLLHLNDNTSMEYYDKKKQITITDTELRHTLTLAFGEDRLGPRDGDYWEWKDVIIANLRLYSAVIQDAETSFNPADGLPNMIKKGVLRMRPPKGGEQWPELLFFLNEAQIVAVSVDIDGGVKMVGDFGITPNCSVFETNLGQNTFELVTASKVLHVRASSPGDVSDWIEAIREAIARSYLDTKDPLFQQSILKIDNDEFYTVSFSEKKPLGVVFERSGEWAIIKSSANHEESGILVGSVLSAIDHHSVVLDGYQQTIDRLKGWRPPLSLSFRSAPSKCGYLLKESKSRSNPQKKVWKKRYFVLGEGKLLYKDNADVGARVKGECPLMGSVVSMIKEGEAGKRNCFRLMSGMMYLTLQSASEKQMMDWASSLYHAISIANGGAYILQYERDRLLAEAEEIAANMELTDEEKEEKIRRRPPGGRSFISVSSRSISSDESSMSRFAVVKMERAERERMERERGAGGAGGVENEMRSYFAANGALQSAIVSADTMDLSDLVAAIEQAKSRGIDVTIAEKHLHRRKNEIKHRDDTNKKDSQAKQNAEIQLEASVFAARYDAFGDLVKMICLAKVLGVKVEAAESRLQELKEEKKRKMEILSALEAAMLNVRPEHTDDLEDAINAAEDEGLDVVQSQLLLLQVRNERRKVADASAQLVKVVQNVGYDAESLHSLELAIAQAVEARVSKENIEKAKHLLASLLEGKQLLDEALVTLQTAIKERSLPLLLEAVSTASEIGFHHEKLQAEVSTAKAIILELKQSDLEDSLERHTVNATVDSFEGLINVIERASGTSCRVNPMKLSKALKTLGELRGRKLEKDEIMTALRIALNERDVSMILAALQTASLRGVGGLEVDTALSLVWTMQREQAEYDLQMAVDEASVDEYSSLEKLVALELFEDDAQSVSQSVTSALSQSSSLSRLAAGLTQKAGAGRSAILIANSRLTHLKAAKKEHTRIQENLSVASAVSDIEGVERAVSEADEIGFVHPSIEEGRVLLSVMHEEQRANVLRLEEEQSRQRSRQELLNAEKQRALAAVETAMNREEPLASTLKRALDTAALLGVPNGPVITAATEMLSKLNKTLAAAALTRAIDTAAFNRDVDTFEEVISKAITEGVDETQVTQANVVLRELKEEKEKKRKAISSLDMAVLNRDSILINDALVFLVNMGGGTTGPEVERAHRVLLELKREVATAALTAALSSSSGITADGFDEEKFLQLEKAVGDTDSCMPSDSSILLKAKSRLEEQRTLKRKCNNASAAVGRAMEAHDIPALEHALKEASALLSADTLLSACTFLASLKQTAAATMLSNAIMSPSDSSKSLSDALEQAKREGVKALKIAEAEVRLVKLRRDEVLRAEIDALLVPAIESKSSELLEQHLHKASSASVTSKTIESARLLLGQLRSQGDKSRILILLKDSLRLRSVAVLEHVVKSAVDAGITGDLLDRAREYLDKLLTRDKELLRQEKDQGGDDLDVAIPRREKAIQDHVDQEVETAGPTTDDYSDDDDDIDDEPEETAKSMPTSPTQTRKRRTLFRAEDSSAEHDFICLFSAYCTKMDGRGAEFINAMQFSSIWRMITGEKGNLFKEMQMYKRFDASNQGSLSMEDFLDGWAKISLETGGSTILRRVKVLAAEGFNGHKKH